MPRADDEDARLRSVALQNARSVRLARQRAEDALRKQAEWLRVTLACIGDAVISTDTEARVTFMNGVAETLTGWTQTDAVGRPLAEIFHIVEEQSRQLADNPCLRALREGKIVGLANHTVLITKNGKERPIDDTAGPIRDEHGNTVGCVLVFRDVTERRQGEKALQASEEELRDFFDNATVGLHWVGPDGIILRANQTELNMLGYPREEYVGRHVAKFHADAEVIEDILRRLSAGETVENCDARLLARDGSIKHVLISANVRWQDGKFLHSRCFTRDITDRKRAEEALRESEKRLREQAEELRRVASRLSEADRRKNEFLAMLAHELRNPLAPLRNALQIVQLAPDDTEAIKSASEMMDRQIGQLVRLVDDLLDMSRVSRGKIELRVHRLELESVISQAIETSRPAIEAAHHELTVTLPARPVYLNGDPVRLAQVFANLLNNSAKYTESGGRIWLTVEPNGGQVVVSVKDTGVGISAEMLPHIFEMFTQVDRTLERSQGGLGIGLTLVRRLVEMHGGTVEAHSQGQGHGSEFTVRLPVVVEQVEPPPNVRAEKSPRMTAPSARRILVVDDNADAANSLAKLLRLAGNQTHVAHDGLEAVDMAEKFRPDVILLDIGLPKLNGYEAARLLRREEWGKGVLLVAMTGWGQEDDRQQSRDAGFDAHLVKPMQFDDLLKLLATPRAAK